MRGIIDAIQNLFDYITRAFEFLINFIKSLVLGLDLLYDSAKFPLVISAYMPTIIGTCMVAIVVASIIKFIWHY